MREAGRHGACGRPVKGTRIAARRRTALVQELVRPKLAKGAAPDTAWAYLGGKFVPIREAKISVMTHAFNYGTGVFEGVRAYWHAEEQQLDRLHFRDHYSPRHRSVKSMRPI